MELPNAHRALIEQKKITEYLFSTTHARGKSKAGFFVRFGFSANNLQIFADALKHQGSNNEVTMITESAWGPRYHVDGIIETPDGRNPRIKTVWQIDLGTDYPRLITAHPLSDRGRNGV